MNRLRLVVLCLALLALRQTSAIGSEEWPQFRGLHAGVAADDPAIPDTWSQTENIAWKLDVPGIGWSSPVAWGRSHLHHLGDQRRADREAPPGPLQRR